MNLYMHIKKVVFKNMILTYWKKKYVFLDQLFEYYSQIGICNNKDVLLVCL